MGNAISEIWGVALFPALYDKAMSIQMKLFLFYVTKSDDLLALATIPVEYQKLAKSVRKHSPNLDEIIMKEDEVQVPQSLHDLCSNNLDEGTRRKNMDEFARHMNKILLSVSGA